MRNPLQLTFALIQRVEDMLAVSIGKEVDEAITEEMSASSRRTVITIWCVLAAFVIYSVIYRNTASIAFDIALLGYSILVSLTYIRRWLLICALLSGVGALSLFLLQLFTMNISGIQTVIEGVSLLAIISPLYYNFRVMLVFNLMGLAIVIVGGLFLRVHHIPGFSASGLFLFLLYWGILLGVSSFFLNRTISLFRRLSVTRRALLRDPLTSVYNRIYLDEIMENRNFHREHQHLAVLMLDLDNFKRLNDNFGHPVGDRVLIHFTQTIQPHIEPFDAIIRMGGEEFLILIKGQGAENLPGYAHRLCLATRESPYSLDGKSSIHITCSMGGAVWDPATESLQRCIERADACLYEAKRAGKNQWVIG